MKKLVCVVFCATLVFLASCGSDNNVVNGNNNDGLYYNPDVETQFDIERTDPTTATTAQEAMDEMSVFMEILFMDFDEGFPQAWGVLGANHEEQSPEGITAYIAAVEDYAGAVVLSIESQVTFISRNAPFPKSDLFNLIDGYEALVKNIFTDVYPYSGNNEAEQGLFDAMTTVDNHFIPMEERLNAYLR